MAHDLYSEPVLINPCLKMGPHIYLQDIVYNLVEGDDCFN